MTGAEISKLTTFAQNYVEYANIDENNNGKIDEGRELKRLLAGTAANSIEELTVDNIKQKILENDTEKIFTAFMTEKSLVTSNLHSLWNNNPLEGIYIENVKDNIKQTLEWSDKAMDAVIKDTDNIKNNIQELNNLDEKANTQKYIDILNQIKENLDDMEHQFTRHYDFGNNKKYGYYFGQRNLERDQVKTEEIPTLTQGLYEADVSTIKNMKAVLESQIQGLKSNEKTPSECLTEIQTFSEQIDIAKKDFKSMKANFYFMLYDDLDFMDKLESSVAKFIADGVASEEEKGEAKELLGQLIEQVSPWSRELLLQQAEAAYKYDADYQPEDNNITTGLETVHDPSKSARDSNGFKKVIMPGYGVVLMNQSTGEIKSLNGVVIKPATR